MSRSLIFLLLAACGLPSDPLLGGQEGEPVAPPPPLDSAVDDEDPSPAPAPPTEDSTGACEVVAHCQGKSWCADYSASTLPDLEVECAGYWAEGPCAIEDALSTCSWGTDLCTVIWLYSDDDGVCR